LGWTVGLNVRIDYRWSAGDAGNIRKHAAELVALAPDVILASVALSRGQTRRRVACHPPHRRRAFDAAGGGWRWEGVKSVESLNVAIWPKRHLRHAALVTRPATIPGWRAGLAASDPARHGLFPAEAAMRR
jgi:hypothetical protein